MAKNQKKQEDTKKVETKKVSKKTSQKTLTLGLVVTLSIAVIILFGVAITSRMSERREGKELMRAFNKAFEQNELTVIYYTSEDCSFCELQTPAMHRIVADYDFNYLEIEKTKLNDQQRREFTKALGVEDVTPLTIVVRAGNVVSYRVGLADGPRLVSLLVRAGVLEEGSKYKPEENLEFIGYNEFIELLNEKEPSAIVIGGVTCAFCIATKPILSNMARAYNIDIHYLTLDYMTRSERELFFDSLEALGFNDSAFKKDGTFSTPNLFIVEDGQISAYLPGMQNVTEYRIFFREHGIIVD